MRFILTLLRAREAQKEIEVAMRADETICYKHDKIMELAGEIMNIAKEIDSFADKAKDDGCNMEHGLITKKDKIEELEKALSDMESDRDKWRDEAEYYMAELERLNKIS
jgi:predicted  nucleic acid-binding Zn-ribbon protein